MTEAFAKTNPHFEETTMTDTLASGQSLALTQPGLTSLVDRASQTLASARSYAEVLEARDMATAAYDAARSADRIMRAKGAHDELIAKVHRAQADALEIEAMAKRRLADEYDAAQERGEVGQQTGRPKVVPDGNDIPTAADLGLSRKDIHEARQIRNAEEANPGVVKRVIEERLEQGLAPTKADLRRAVAPRVSQPDPAPADAERRKLAKLTPEAMIDEIIGLRADLSDEKAKSAKLKAERDDLEARLKEASATDGGRTVANLRREITTLKGRMAEYQTDAKRYERRAKKAEARVKELENMPVDMGAP